MGDISALVRGFENFQLDYQASQSDTDIAYAQSPEVLIIACCDSRVDPAIITNSEAGDVMVVRNIANLVPPFEEQSRFCETQAAVELAMVYLEVKNIIVMGHSRCGGIRALLTRLRDDLDPSHTLDEWTMVAEPAGRKVLADMKSQSLDDQVCACSREALKQSLENLANYPWVAEALSREQVQLHGWYFNLGEGALEALDPKSGQFAPLRASNI